MFWNRKIPDSLLRSVLNGGAFRIFVAFLFAGLWLSPAHSAQPQLRTYGGRTLPEWRETVKNEPLASLGTPQTVQGLVEIISDPDAPWADRRQFALTLGRIGAPARDAVPALKDLLTTPKAGVDVDSDSVRLWALKALGLMGLPAAGATEEVRQLVVDSSQPFMIRSTAMETLAQIGSESDKTLPTLLSILSSDKRLPDSHSVRELRRSAAEAIALLGPVAAPALPELIRALGSDWPILRRSAATAIGALGAHGEIAVPPLADMVLFDDDPDPREAAADALGQIGPAALPSLEHLMFDQEVLVRRLAIRSLRSMQGDPAATDFLRRKLTDAVPLVRAEAAEALLFHTPDTVAIQVLLGGLREEDRQPRITAYRALREHADQLGSFESTLQQIESDPDLDSQSRLAARRLLGLIDAAP